MRIKDLLEGKQFNDLDWITIGKDNQRELNYDLAEDLAFFMNNDDDVYRRHTYPSIVKCINQSKLKAKTTPSLFEKAVQESYKSYLKKFPLRELPSNIDEKICKETCEKIHEEVCQHISDGKYKD